MKLIRLFSILALLGLIIGCGGDKTTAPEPTDNSVIVVVEIPDDYLPFLDSIGIEGDTDLLP